MLKMSEGTGTPSSPEGTGSPCPENAEGSSTPSGSEGAIITPSAPSTDEINRITELTDILQVQENDLPEVYFQSLQIIHQYTVEEIQSVLNDIPMNALSQVHQVLCAKVSATHHEFQGRRIIKRSVLKTVITDLINLGLCLMNGDVNRELDKIFLEKVKGTNTSPSDDIYSKYVELMGLVSMQSAWSV